MITLRTLARAYSMPCLAMFFFLATMGAHAERPTISSITTTEPSPTGNSEVTYTVTWDQPVIGFTAGRITLNYPSVSSEIAVTGGPEIYDVKLSNLFVQADLSITVRANANIVNDLDESYLGNTTSPVITIDAARASLLAISARADEVDDDDTLLVDFNFSRQVANFDAADIAVFGPPAFSFTTLNVTGGPQDYVVEMSGPTRAGELSISLSNSVDIVDVYGRALVPPIPTETVLSTHQAPQLTGITRQDGDVVTDTELVLDATFNQPVTGVDIADFSIVPTGLNYESFAISGGPQAYAITISGLAGDGSLTVEVSEVFSASGPGDEPVMHGENTALIVPVDLLAPSVVLSTADSEVLDTGAITIDINFTEAVTGVDATDLSIQADGVTYGNLDLTGSGASYQAVLDDLSGEGSIQVSLSPTNDIVDRVNQPVVPGEDSVDVIVRLDIPSLSAITPQESSPTNAESGNFAVTFDRAVVNVDAGDFVVTATDGLAFGEVSLSGDGASYVLTVSGLIGEGNLSVSIASGTDIVDARDAPLAESELAATLQVDRVAPALTSFEVFNPTLALLDVAQVLVQFSEPVQGLDAEDFLLTGDAAVNAQITVEAESAGYSLHISPLAVGTAQVGLVEGATITDLAGNSLQATASTSFNVVSDGPRVQSISDPYNRATNANPLEFTVTFTNATVTSLNPASVVIDAEGQAPTLTVVPSLPNRFIVRLAGLTGMGTASISIPHGAQVQDGLAPVALGRSSQEVEFDYVAPTYSLAYIDSAVLEPHVPAQVALTLSEPVRSIGFANTLVTASGFSAFDYTFTGSGLEYVFSITVGDPSAAGSVILGLKQGILDVAGNAMTPLPSLSLPVDFIGPDFLGLTPQNGQLNVADPRVGVRFSETVLGFGVENVSIEPAGAVEIVDIVSAGTDYEFALAFNGTQTAQLVVNLDESVTDGNGKPLSNTGTYSLNLRYDNERPRLLSVSPGADVALLEDGVINLTFAFSEPVNTLASLVQSMQVVSDGVQGAAVLGVVNQEDPTRLSVNVQTGGGEGTVRFSIPPGTVLDGAGNTTDGAVTTPEYVVDTILPGLANLTVLPAVVQAGDTVELVLAAEENISGASVSVLGGEAWPIEGDASTLRFVYETSHNQPAGMVNVAATFTDIFGRESTYLYSTAFEVTAGTPVPDDVAPKAEMIDFIEYIGPEHTAVFEVTFNESVRRFGDGGDVLVRQEGTSHSGVRVERLADSAHYLVYLEGISGEGSLALDVYGGDVVDFAGNVMITNTFGNMVEIDARPPVVESINRASSGIHTEGDLIFDVTFSEPVQNLTAREVPLGLLGTAYARVLTSGSGTLHTVTIKGVRGNGALRVGVGGAGEATDSFGNVIEEIIWGEAVLVNTGVAAVRDAEGETEGDLDSGDAVLIALLQGFAAADSNGDGRLDWHEVLAAQPEVSIAAINDADFNLDGFVTVGELLRYRGGGHVHTGDTDGDGSLELDELIRVVQLYNAGAYACAGTLDATEDGFELVDEGDGPGELECQPHAVDYQQADNMISLSEMLRIIQLYNAAGFDWCLQTEDGFCAE